MGLKSKFIKSEDPQAVEKLTAKLEECQNKQDEMKRRNAYYRKNNTMKGYPEISVELAMELDRTVSNSNFNKPYPEPILKNGITEMIRIKKRIKQINKIKEIGYVGWDFDGGKAVVNKELYRLQLFFDKSISGEQCNELISNGFLWSVKNQAWQRQLNDNAILAASRVSFIQPKNNCSIRSLQPKTPAKDDLTR